MTQLDPAATRPAMDARVLAALPDPFTADPSAAHRLVTTWWDSPDWRLHRAGLALGVHRGPQRSTTGLPTRGRRASGWAQLISDQAPTRTQPLDAATWVTPSAPQPPALLPDGELAAVVVKVAGLRALLPLVTVTEIVTPVAVLDADGKTVVRLRIVEPATGVSALPAAVYAVGGVGEARPELAASGWVEVQGLRGYARQAGTVARALDEAGLAVLSVLPGTPADPATRPATAAGAGTGAPGSAATTESSRLIRAEIAAAPTPRPADVARLLTAAGLRPGRRLPRREASLAPSSPAPVAIATMLLSFLDDVEVNEAGVVDDVDTEFLHDLRIAVRRSRSALKLAADVLPPALVAEFAPRLKWMGDVTTPLRDLDVHLLDLPAAAARLRGFTAADLVPFAEFLRKRRDAERRRLARTIRSAQWVDLRTQWRAALEAVIAAPAEDAVGTGVLGARKVARADRRVTRLGSAITPASPAEDLHTLRKRAKELRYVLELFAPVLDPAAVKALVADLKGFQDVLGRFQDAEVQRDAVVSLAGELAASSSAAAGRAGEDLPVATLLALGELAGQLAVDQVTAREAFDGRFAEYLAPAARAHVAALTAVPERSAKPRAPRKGSQK